MFRFNLILVLILGFALPVTAADSWSKVFAFQTKMASKGNVSAQFILGEMYEQGRGVEQSYDKALEWYGKAEKNGHKQASNRIVSVKKLMSAPPKQVAKKPVAKKRAVKKPVKSVKALPKPKPVSKPEKPAVIAKKVEQPVVAEAKKEDSKPVRPARQHKPEKIKKRKIKAAHMDTIDAFDDDTVSDADETVAKKAVKQKKSFLDVEDAFE